MTRIDLNCDMGEQPERIADGTQDAILRHVTTVNVACGEHAGDDATMEATVRSAALRGRAVGAHPGYPDRQGFGRRSMAMSPDEVAGMVHRQIVRLAAIAERCGARLRHVKPHGALYNDAAHDTALASAVAQGVRRFRGDLILVGLAGSPSLEAYAGAGFEVAAEAFADRRYEPDGRLRSRALPDALLSEPARAAEQALGLARDGAVTASNGKRLELRADTLCLHGDTPGASAIAEAVAGGLRAGGVALAPLGADTIIGGHPANAALRRYCEAGRPGVAPLGYPEEVHRPYDSLGTHPDLVAHLWDELGAALPADCRVIFCGTPALAHPGTGVVFGFAGGTHTCALRLPEETRREALAAGARSVMKYPRRADFDLAVIGAEWLFCGWAKGEKRFCRAAYEFAARAGDTPSTGDPR